MYHFKKYLTPCIWILFFGLNIAVGQTKKIEQSVTVRLDSLKVLLDKSKKDVSKLAILVKLSSSPYPEEALKYAKEAIELADVLMNENENASSEQKKRILTEKGSAICSMGYASEQSGDIITAVDYYTKSLKIYEETGYKKGIAIALNNIGAVKDNQGNIPEALKYYEKSLQIQQEIGDKTGIATSLNNIGFVYKSQGDIVKALENYNKSLKIQEEVGDKIGMATSLNNIGVIYRNKGDNDMAMTCFEKSLKIREAIDDKKGIARSLNTIGGMYKRKKEYVKALDYFERSLKIKEQLGDQQGIANSLYSMGGIYMEQSNLKTASGEKKKLIDLAFSYSSRSLLLAKQLGFPEIIKSVEETLTKIDSTRGNYAGALEHYKQYIIYKDSINNDGNRKASIKNQLKYEFEKKEAVIKEQQEKEKLIADEKNQRQQIIIWLVAGGLFLVVVFAGFIYRSLKLVKQQKRIIEQKQKEILDSIHYAKKIQQSLLPSETLITKNLKRLKRN